MSVEYQKIIDDLSAITLEGPGHTTAELRQSVAAYASDLSLEQPADNSQIPTDFIPYLDKVSLYAYKVLDRNVDELKSKNYSEDEIFELTISAALGAGLARLERGLALLDEGGNL
jgi:hypothetical protein